MGPPQCLHFFRSVNDSDFRSLSICYTWLAAMQNCPFPTHTSQPMSWPLKGHLHKLTSRQAGKAAVAVPLRPIKPQSHPTTSQKSQLTRPAGTRTSLQRPFSGVGVWEGWRSVLSLRRQPNIAQISARETPHGSHCTISRVTQLRFQLGKTRLGCRETCRGPPASKERCCPSVTHSRNAPPSLRPLC